MFLHSMEDVSCTIREGGERNMAIFKVSIFRTCPHSLLISVSPIPGPEVSSVLKQGDNYIIKFTYQVCIVGFV